MPKGVEHKTSVYRATSSGSSERVLYRKVARFEVEGVDSLFAAESSKRRGLPPAIRCLVVDPKAEHPPMRPHEISTIPSSWVSRRSGKAGG
jgi:hypothetical protein